MRKRAALIMILCVALLGVAKVDHKRGHQDTEPNVRHGLIDCAKIYDEIESTKRKLKVLDGAITEGPTSFVLKGMRDAFRITLRDLQGYQRHKCPEV